MRYPQITAILALLTASCANPGGAGSDCAGPVSSRQAAACASRGPNECEVSHAAPAEAGVQPPPGCPGEPEFYCEDWGVVRCSCDQESWEWECSVIECAWWACEDAA